MLVSKQGEAKKIITHNGSFHCDEIFACATIILFHPNVNFEITRTRDPAIIKTGDFVVDVGQVYNSAMNLFDHHQREGAGKRPNGIPYASFGLVWLRYGKDLCGSEEVAKKVDERLVSFIDAIDNGVSIFSTLFEDVAPYTIIDFFTSFEKYEVSEEENSQTFIRLVEEAKNLLNREIEKEKITESLRNLVEEIYMQSSGKEIIVLPRKLPWRENLSRKQEPLFVIYPNDHNNNWHVVAVPVKVKSFELRRPFPESWAGLAGKELSQLTGVGDAVFCHRARFVAIAGSKEGALKLAELAMST